MRAYANIANEMLQAGYTASEISSIKAEVARFENFRSEVKLHSGDAIDLKMYEPAMRHLIDMYIKAEDSTVVSQLNDLTLVDLIVRDGATAVDAMPEGIRHDETAVAETIENNVRRLIIDETPINPRYYEHMSTLLSALIEERRLNAISYERYLERIIELTRQAQQGPASHAYPSSLNTPAKRALFDNLEQNETLALRIDTAVRAARQDDWRNHPIKQKKVMLAIKKALADLESHTNAVFNLVMNQDEY